MLSGNIPDGGRSHRHPPLEGILAQGSDRLTDFADFHQGYVSQYIQLADAKAGVVITVSGALIGYLLSHATFAAAIGVGSLMSWLCLATIVALVASFLLAFWAVRPRGGRPTGPIYFASVARFEDAEAYRKHVASMSERELAEARLDHCYAISKIADEKYLALRWAMLAALVGAVGTALSLKLLPL